MKLVRLLTKCFGCNSSAIQATDVYSNRFKGVMTPPVLMDLTGDGVVDIVFATYNSSVLAIDGETFGVLWNYTYPFSETYA